MSNLHTTLTLALKWRYTWAHIPTMFPADISQWYQLVYFDHFYDHMICAHSTGIQQKDTKVFGSRNRASLWRCRPDIRPHRSCIE